MCVCVTLLNSFLSLQQAQVAAQLGLEKLSEVGVATARPEDYFAEMIKADNHMRKV